MKYSQNIIPVIVKLIDGTSERGLLEYSKSGPSIQHLNRRENQDAIGVTFRLDKSDEFHHKQLRNIVSVLKRDDIVVLDPVYCSILGYSEEPIRSFEMYPPSSGGWISHVVESGENAVYTIQKLLNRNRFLLTISHFDNNNILGTFLLHYYEIGILGMKRDWDIHRELFSKQTAQMDIEEYLDKAPPSWSFISKLSEGITIPNLRIMKTMGETMGQFVPHSFPPTIRSQLIAFLSWLETAEIPNQDPMEFYSRYASVDTFRTMVWGHLMCLLEDANPPNYTRIFSLADKGGLSLTQKPLVEPELQNTWYQARDALFNTFPDRMKRALRYALLLNQSKRIVSKLPVSKKEAKNSRESWGNRYAMIFQGLMMRGHVVKERLGLRAMMYIGGAHRWPHPHIEFSARLGYQKEKPQQLQIMVLPITAVEKVTRLLSTIRPIVWERSAANLSLYNAEKREWKMNVGLIEKSLERSRSLSQLRREFGDRPIEKQVSLTPIQAKVLDMVSWGLYLGSLETGVYSEYSGIESKDIEGTILELEEGGVISIEYTLSLRKLTSVHVNVEGPPRNIYSFCRSMLKHAPSAAVRISEGGNSCSVIARVPEDKAFNFITTLPSIGQERNIAIEVVPISAYISYRNNLYQRLLRDDGTWDDDLSGLLSQVRLRPKDSH